MVLIHVFDDQSCLERPAFPAVDQVEPYGSLAVIEKIAEFVGIAAVFHRARAVFVEGDHTFYVSAVNPGPGAHVKQWKTGTGIRSPAGSEGKASEQDDEYAELLKDGVLLPIS